LKFSTKGYKYGNNRRGIYPLKLRPHTLAYIGYAHVFFGKNIFFDGANNL